MGRYPPLIAVPRDLRPMLATPAKDLPVDDEHWAYEMKWDGMRALVGVEGGDVWLTSRAGNDATTRFPELLPIGDALGGVDALLDGEIVALDESGAPSFELLQPRMQAHGRSAVQERAATTPVVLMVFDVLWLAGHSTLELTYTERRTLLERLGLAGPSWQTPPTTYGAMGEGTGEAVREASRALGLEGVVAKRIDSPYRPGKRADSWRKVKSVVGQELVVGGWLPGAGRLEGQLGSLLVGYHDDGVLRFAGRVGSGIDADQARAAHARTRAPAPRRLAVRVDPEAAEAAVGRPRARRRSRLPRVDEPGRVAGAALPRVARRQAGGRGRARDLTPARSRTPQYRPAHDRRPGRARRHRASRARPRRHGHAARARRRRPRTHRRGEPTARRGDPSPRRARSRRGRRRPARRPVPRRADPGEGSRRVARRRAAAPRQPDAPRPRPRRRPRLLPVRPPARRRLRHRREDQHPGARTPPHHRVARLPARPQPLGPHPLAGRLERRERGGGGIGHGPGRPRAATVAAPSASPPARAGCSASSPLGVASRSVPTTARPGPVSSRGTW